MESAVGFPGDFDYCRRVIKDGSKSFHFASLLLPNDIRQAAFATYAFCRVADDEIDLGADPIRALEDLSERLDRIYRGAPRDHPVDRAFSSVVRTYDLPRTLPDALLEGMRWDTESRQYQSLEDLQAYAARVAGTVGAMMTVLMGNRTPVAVARACDLGSAMQLTNIARDVGEDARAGRLYLPVQWLQDAGLDPSSFLAAPQATEGMRAVVKRLLELAQPIYERGLSGVSLLPQSCQTSILAAGKIYREIGEEIRRRDYDSITQRAIVSKRRKVRLLAEAAFETRLAPSQDAALEASRFLVRAIDDAGTAAIDPISPTRVNWTIDLFMRLEKRERSY
ncbi:MAG: phytoene/squalene synthase family protein [Pseudomonadota bacterium]